jgi:hypothetical protein
MSAIEQSNGQDSLKTLRGRLISDKSEALIFASVGLHKSTDSTLIKGTLTDSTGNFEMGNITLGEYLISVSTINTNKKILQKITINFTNHAIIDIGNIIVIEKTQELNEVTIKAKKPFIEQKLDRIVANVAGSVFA